MVGGMGGGGREDEKGGEPDVEDCAGGDHGDVALR